MSEIACCHLVNDENKAIFFLEGKKIMWHSLIISRLHLLLSTCKYIHIQIFQHLIADKEAFVANEYLCLHMYISPYLCLHIYLELYVYLCIIIRILTYVYVYIYILIYIYIS